MIVYSNTKKGFVDDVFSNGIADKIYAQYIETFGRRVGDAEVNSWKISMSFMDRVVKDINITVARFYSSGTISTEDPRLEKPYRSSRLWWIVDRP